jgi:membrane-associated phospholipid phosphatase
VIAAAAAATAQFVPGWPSATGVYRVDDPATGLPAGAWTTRSDLSWEDYAGKGIDRVRLSPSRPWKTYTDIALGASFAMIVLPSRYRVGETWGRPWLTSTTIIAESALGTFASTTLLKKAVHRRRPWAYVDADSSWIDLGGSGAEHDDALVFDPREAYVRCQDSDGPTDDWCFASPDAFWSFPSGHSAMVASGFTAWGMTFALQSWKKPSPRVWRWAIPVIAAVGVGGSVAIGRVEANNHFPTDVLAGLALGVGWGVAVPLTHYRREPLPDRPKCVREVQLSPTPGGLALSGTW